MLYFFGGLLTQYAAGLQSGSFFKTIFSHSDLLQSYSVLIVLSMYTGFILVRYFMPKFFDFMPHDRGREFTVNAEAAKGKPTGSGVFFISAFVLLSFVFVPMNFNDAFWWLKPSCLALTWLMMLTGYLDDRSTFSWGEYRKALLDLVISVAASVLLAFYLKNSEGKIHFWLPIFKQGISVAPWVFICISTVMLWASVNTTNCTDGVDGLSSTLVLIALLTMGFIFYFILGYNKIAEYLIVPHFKDGASWAVMTFCLAGVLMGYLWHNAFPSRCLMGDAGSRALGFFIGLCVMISGNPFMIFATSTIICINGGMGLLKVFLKRFFKINFFSSVRFPLHDHMRVNHQWSPTQVLIRFMMLQLLITLAIVGILFKIR